MKLGLMHGVLEHTGYKKSHLLNSKLSATADHNEIKTYQQNYTRLFKFFLLTMYLILVGNISQNITRMYHHNTGQ